MFVSNADYSIGIAALMALDLGLHKQGKDLPLVEHERRVRVFWNIFVYEKCVFTFYYLTEKINLNLFPLEF